MDTNSNQLPNSFQSLSCPSRRGLLASLSLTLLALSACGGGGGGASAPPANGNPAANPAGNPAGPAPAYARLWVPNYNAGELRAWTRAALANDVDGMPDVTLTLPATSRPNALTFDATGALWVTDNFNNRLLQYGRGQLAATGAPVPQVSITSNGTSLANPIGLCFDGADNLWVAVTARLEMFIPTNLDNSGPTTPNRILQADLMDVPAQILFDAAGNLWLTSASFTPNRNAVLVFTPDQLAAGGMQVPRLTLRSNAFALVEGMRFDRAGNLWVSSNDGLNVARFDAANVALPAVATTRTLSPNASIEANLDDSATGRSVRKPGGLVFDRDGNLFVNSERGAVGGNSSAVVMFSAQQLLGLVGGQALSATRLIARSTSNPGFGGLALELP